MIDEVIRAYPKFYDMVDCNMINSLRHGLDVDLIGDEVGTTLRHLPNGKSLDWDDQVIFQKFWGHPTLMF